LSAAFKQDDVFVFVKAYASRGSLLSRAFLEELANSRSVDEMAGKLKATAYGELVTTAAGGMSARKLESMLRSSLSVFNYELIKYYRKPGFLQGYFERNLSWNLKVAVKGKAMGLSYEDLSDMIVLRAEELAGRRDLIVRILSASSLEQVVALLSDSDVKPYLAQAMAAYRQTKDVSTFDLYVDRYTLGKLVDAFAPKEGRLRKLINRLAPKEGRLRKLINRLAPKKGRLRRLYGRPNAVVESLVAADVDSFNILAVLRSKWLELPEAKARELLITPAFYIEPETLERMLSTNTVQAAASALSHSVYRKLIPSATTPEGLISGVEDAFYRKALTTAKHTFSSQPMSEPVLLGALKAKEVEVRNLSSIAFGLEVGLQPSAIIAKLITV
jgi:V/A-type H+-transporting ATPase subunit C